MLPSLSVVVPAYKEEQWLPATPEKVAAFVRENVDGPSEVLVVNDGSTAGLPSCRCSNLQDLLADALVDF